MRIDSMSELPEANGPNSLMARAKFIACAVETCTAVPIWWRMDVSQLAHMKVPQMTSPFNMKDRSYHGEGGIPMRGM